MAEERVILDAYGVRVTTQRFVAGPTTYAMTNITSVTTIEKAPGYFGPKLFLGMGAFGMFLALVNLEPQMVSGALGLLAVGGAWYQSRKGAHQWVIVVRTAAGEADAFVSLKREEASAVNEALNNAIIARG